MPAAKEGLRLTISCRNIRIQNGNSKEGESTMKHKYFAAVCLAAIVTAAGTVGVTGKTLNTPVTATAADDCNDDWLHCEGSRIFDKDGKEVWLTGANWFGFNCTENSPHYLWSGDIDDLVRDIADHGVNILRLPVSTELLYNWMIGDPDPIESINPNNDPSYPFNVDLIRADGSVVDSKELFDILLAKCKHYGVKAFIDIHSPESNNSGHNYGLWYGKSFTANDGKKVEVTTDVWIETLAWCAEEYKNDDTLLGFDLKNEPHSKYGGAPIDAIWDDSDAPNNWKKAAEDCADAILKKNPNALILIEGVEGFEGHGAWWGGNLRGVRKYPVKPDAGTGQIVYSPHDYGPIVSDQTWFHKDFTEATLLDDYWRDTWAYLVEEDMYPLLIGEWGGKLDGGDNEKWLGLLRDYMIKHHINHTFWCLNDDSGDTGGLWKDIQFGTTQGADGTITGKTTINWDETKYKTYYYPAIWKTSDSKKFIGLDHQTALGQNGISLSEYYSSYANSEGSNLDGGSKGSTGHSVEISTTPTKTTTEAPKTTTTTETTKAVITTPAPVITTPAPDSTTKSDTTGSGARQETWGDTNLDGSVDVSDAVLLSKYLVSDKTAQITDQGIANSAVTNGNSDVVSDDVTKILQFIARMISEQELAPQK